MTSAKPLTADEAAEVADHVSYAIGVIDLRLDSLPDDTAYDFAEARGRLDTARDVLLPAPTDEAPVAPTPAAGLTYAEANEAAVAVGLVIESLDDALRDLRAGKGDPLGLIEDLSAELARPREVLNLACADLDPDRSAYDDAPHPYLLIENPLPTSPDPLHRPESEQTMTAERQTVRVYDEDDVTAVTVEQAARLVEHGLAAPNTDDPGDTDLRAAWLFAYPGHDTSEDGPRPAARWFAQTGGGWVAVSVDESEAEWFAVGDEDSRALPSPRVREVYDLPPSGTLTYVTETSEGFVPVEDQEVRPARTASPAPRPAADLTYTAGSEAATGDPEQQIVVWVGGRMVARFPRPAHGDDPVLVSVERGDGRAVAGIDVWHRTVTLGTWDPQQPEGQREWIEFADLSIDAPPTPGPF